MLFAILYFILGLIFAVRWWDNRIYHFSDDILTFAFYILLWPVFVWLIQD